MNEAVQIRSINKRNGLTLTLAGGLGLVIALTLFLSGSHLFAPGIICFALGSIALVLGVAKLLEPEVTAKLTEQGVTYFHRRGQVVIAWDNIQRLDQLRVSQGLETLTLPYIGIKLKLVSPVLECISLRLATGLLTEQRPLLMTASTQGEDLSILENQMSEEFTPFIENNDRYKGVLAMFGHRSRLLNSHLGYHLFISTDALDRPVNEFLILLKEYQQNSLE
ncbi:conserved hypothetical protein [Shewanella halifaxensis HAW-EB4]|uniref:DUF2982 domain-containing protein n=1 Tax=Shewanella halifaxensis (strain HAW-EB4) TaxID=458817 RepID=B0TNA6_SHEHH|nr:DUF2982 domain-containing protein [Shewanella halifaxensis]ABZ76092.1 conserved hypothetical protein [Shewanella halifaxensis HAW-EB4]